MDTTASAQTLVDLLRQQADRYQDRPAFLFCPDGDEEQDRITYRELDSRARAIAATLRQRGGAGKRVLVLCRPGLDSIAGIFGCLYAGAVAVPVDEQWASPRIAAIVPDARADFALATGKSQAKMRDTVAGLVADQPVRWCALDADAGEVGDPAVWQPPDVDPSTVAMLQYTSGSSGPPKGAVVTHRNLLHNLRAIHRGLNPAPDGPVFTSDVTGVSWLPNYHDMGLIGGVLGTLYAGRTTMLMSPGSFLIRPMRWLQAMSRYRAVVSAAPNYAYDWCVKRSTPEERAALDLSNWAVAVIGAEPIRVETLRTFAEAFAPAGFRPEAFRPAYGQVEATMGISGLSESAVPVIRHIDRGALEENRVADASPDDPTAGPVVGCGSPQGYDHVVLVDPESCRLRGPDEVGEIWVAGPSVTEGYWGKPEETERTFQAQLAEPDRSGYRGPFLRTGDLGFLRAGELFVTGRFNDLITIQGRNYYPSDIENTVTACDPALLPSRGAAFTITPKASTRSSVEQLVVVQEIHRHRVGEVEPSELIGTIRAAINEHHKVEPSAVILVKPMRIPTTSSGKVQRSKCRKQYLAGELEPVAQWHAPPPPPERAFDIRDEVLLGVTRILRRAWERQNIRPPDL